MRRDQSVTLPARGAPFDGTRIPVYGRHWHVAKPVDDVAIDFAGGPAATSIAEIKERIGGLAEPISKWAIYTLEFENDSAFWLFYAELTSDETGTLSGIQQDKWPMPFVRKSE